MGVADHLRRDRELPGPGNLVEGGVMASAVAQSQRRGEWSTRSAGKRRGTHSLDAQHCPTGKVKGDEFLRGAPNRSIRETGARAGVRPPRGQGRLDADGKTKKNRDYYTITDLILLSSSGRNPPFRGSLKSSASSEPIDLKGKVTALARPELPVTAGSQE